MFAGIATRGGAASAHALKRSRLQSEATLQVCLKQGCDLPPKGTVVNGLKNYMPCITTSATESVTESGASEEKHI
ncbi:unnamed protein product [Pieris macdunnoughi]|uniref:Uncharacterized protein n=1 Tax=Pieris macdunnoughi TaxID=345717 RepID=A0A821LW05_9NEOP|nr:unnamed protein product [Pieris macdunnoughi]